MLFCLLISFNLSYFIYLFSKHQNNVISDDEQASEIRSNKEMNKLKAQLKESLRVSKRLIKEVGTLKQVGNCKNFQKRQLYQFRFLPMFVTGVNSEKKEFSCTPDKDIRLFNRNRQFFSCTPDKDIRVFYLDRQFLSHLFISPRTA